MPPRAGSSPRRSPSDRRPAPASSAGSAAATSRRRAALTRSTHRSRQGSQLTRTTASATSRTAADRAHANLLLVHAGTGQVGARPRPARRTAGTGRHRWPATRRGSRRPRPPGSSSSRRRSPGWPRARPAAPAPESVAEFGDVELFRGATGAEQSVHELSGYGAVPLEELDGAGFGALGGDSDAIAAMAWRVGRGVPRGQRIPTCPGRRVRRSQPSSPCLNDLAADLRRLCR